MSKQLHFNLVRKVLAILLLPFISVTLFAQSAPNPSKVIGSLGDVYRSLYSSQMNEPQSVKTLQTPEGTISVNLNVEGDYIGGKVEGDATSRIYFYYVDGKLNGSITFPAQRMGYRYSTDENNNVVVEKVDINQLICFDYPKYEAPATHQEEVVDAPKSPSVIILNSLPGADAVLMLDFDGFNCTGNPWGTINAASANYTDDKVRTAWEIAAEDYRPYKINVTTDESVFQACAQKRRRRVVITPTNDAAKGAGGVSYIGVFSNGNDNDVAWVFNVNGNGRVAGETCSHEAGHNVGLNHDGPNYYMGHSNKAWAPIMGAAYDDNIGQWSKGEYQGADQKEDDLVKIGNNVFGWRVDEAGNDIAGAKALVVKTGGVVNKEDNYGVITTAADIDVYKFDCAPGSLTLKVGTDYAQPVPNLDVLLKLTDALGAVIATVDDKTSMHATVTANITTPGTYYLHIDGTGKDDPLSTGYSDYASVGEYYISGSVPLSIDVKEVSSDAASFYTYPNPGSGEVYVNIGKASSGNQIKVTNMVGEVIYDMVTNSRNAIVNFANQPKGVYFITVTNDYGTTTKRHIAE